MLQNNLAQITDSELEISFSFNQFPPHNASNKSNCSLRPPLRHGLAESLHRSDTDIWSGKDFSTDRSLSYFKAVFSTKCHSNLSCCIKQWKQKSTPQTLIWKIKKRILYQSRLCLTEQQSLYIKLIFPRHPLGWWSGHDYVHINTTKMRSKIKLGKKGSLKKIQSASISHLVSW